MPLLSEELKDKHTPVVVNIVLGLEWLLAVVFTLLLLIFIWFTFVWDVLGGKQAAFRLTGDEYDVEDIVILTAICLVASLFSFALVVLLGKAITKRSITKCKAWLWIAGFRLLALTIAYAYLLVQNYLENYYFLAGGTYLGYVSFSLVTIYNFIRQLQCELADEYKLFPSPFV